MGSKLKSELDVPFSRALGFDFSRGIFDIPLFFVILILLGYGLISCFSGYYFFSAQQFNQSTGLYYFIGRQALWVAVSIVACAWLTMVKPEFFYKITPALWVITVVTNALPAFGSFGSIRGGRRWLDLGAFSFQPSELAKLTLALYLARALYRREERLDKEWSGTIKPAIMTALMCVPIYFQNDLSTTLFVFGMSIVILFLGGVPIKYVVMETLIGFGVAIPAIILTGFRLDRLASWIHPDRALLGVGRQPAMAKLAIKSSGLFGVGLGNGTYKLGKISMVHSDYIFASVVEETGLVGALVVLVLFALLIYRGRAIALKTHRGYERTLAISLALLLGSQALLNMAVVAGIFPVTGVPLPFFSAGGTSVLVSASMCGILLNLSRSRS